MRRMTEDNLFILNGLIELKKERGEEILVGCLDLEKAYDRVDRGKLWSVLRKRGMNEDLVKTLERIYEGVKVKFMLGRMSSEWVEVRRGVRQGCPLSPTLFNLYIAEVAEVLEEEGGGVKYAREGEGEEMIFRDIKGMLYADDICILADGERDGRDGRGNTTSSNGIWTGSVRKEIDGGGCEWRKSRKTVEDG